MPRWPGIAAVLATVLLGAVDARAQGVVALRTIPPGTILHTADLGPAGNDAAALAERDAMVGLETRRAIYAGRRVVPDDLGPPTLVRRNDLVAMRFLSGRLEIRADGRALESGGVGEPIRVLNLDSRQTVTARVVASAQVEIRR